MLDKVVCFDLDGVIAIHPTNGSDYVKYSTPNEKIIEQMRKLKNKGFQIAIYTARKMQTSDHNVGKAIARASLETFNWLDKYNVPFDCFYWGKPNAIVYIDDKAFGYDCDSVCEYLDKLEG